MLIGFRKFVNDNNKKPIQDKTYDQLNIDVIYNEYAVIKVKDDNIRGDII